MKKVFIILFALFVGCALFAQEDSAPKELPPMYAGGVMGLDGHCGPYMNHYFWSFAFEPHFGIYPFAKKNMGIEASFRLVTKNEFNKGYSLKDYYTETYTALFVRYMYEFKAFEDVPKLNIYSIAGFGIAFRQFEWPAYSSSRADETGDGWYLEKENRPIVTIPLGAGVRYQLQDHLEAVAQAEFGLSYLLGFNLSVGVNYKF